MNIIAYPSDMEENLRFTADLVESREASGSTYKYIDQMTDDA